ncbi:MAG TPA: hypothetical protein V6D17_03395 [Candidatus Obscuribacterales bacterium]
MSETQLGPTKWDTIRHRRQDDLAFGIARVREIPGFADDVFGENGWKLIYDEPKLYHVNDRAETRVRVWVNADKTRVVKLDDPGMVVDQMSAIARLRRRFGVTVPRHMYIIEDGGVRLLHMEFMRFISGYQVRKMAKGELALPKGVTAASEDLFDLYERTWEFSRQVKEYLLVSPFDVTGMHHGNYGVRSALLRSWRKGQTLKPRDFIVFDPVSMVYDKPKK